MKLPLDRLTIHTILFFSFDLTENFHWSTHHSPGSLEALASVSLPIFLQGIAGASSGRWSRPRCLQILSHWIPRLAPIKPLLSGLWRRCSPNSSREVAASGNGMRCRPHHPPPGASRTRPLANGREPVAPEHSTAFPHRRPLRRRASGAPSCRVAPPPAPPLALLPHPLASARRGTAQSAAAPVPSCGGATGPTPARVSSTPICGANRHRSSSACLCPPPAGTSLVQYLALANVQQQRQCLCPLLAWQLHQRHPPVAPTAGIHRKRGHDEAVATSNSVKAPSPPKPLGNPAT